MSTITLTAAFGAVLLFAATSPAGADEPAPASRDAAAQERKVQLPPAGPASPAPRGIAVPAKPQQTSGDPGGGGQGRQSQQVVALPDLALVGDFQLATATIPWGNSGVVTTDAASSTKGGLCGFRYKYTVRNQGNALAGAATHRIRRDTQNGQIVANNALAPLAPAATAVSDGHLWLKPGTWMLYVHADDPQAVAESDEQNNLRRVKVTVKGRCG